MKDESNISDVLSLRPDYLGFIFYGPSKRFVEGLSPDFVRQLNAAKKVGVFVNASFDEIDKAINSYGLDLIQLHGREEPAFLEKVKTLPVRVIKAFGVSANFDWQLLSAYQGLVDYFLFDTKTATYGGSGETFDWTLLQGYTLQVPYFLSGGLGPANMHDVNHLDDPRLYAIDVNSKFESSPGFKDVQLLKKVLKMKKL